MIDGELTYRPLDPAILAPKAISNHEIPAGQGNLNLVPKVQVSRNANHRGKQETRAVSPYDLVVVLKYFDSGLYVQADRATPTDGTHRTKPLVQHQGSVVFKTTDHSPVVHAAQGSVNQNWRPVAFRDKAGSCSAHFSRP
jgi:hypothetical protein